MAQRPGRRQCFVRGSDFRDCETKRASRQRHPLVKGHECGAQPLCDSDVKRVGIPQGQIKSTYICLGAREIVWFNLRPPRAMIAPQIKHL